MALVSLQSVNGVCKGFHVTNSEVILADVQQQVLALFDKPFDTTWVYFVDGSEKHTLPTSKPFLRANTGDVLSANFRDSKTVELTFVSGDKSETFTLERNLALRDVQKLLCSTFRQRFPLMCANLKSAHRTFADFNDTPFVDAEDLDGFDVEFDTTTDMFFFDLFDRKREPSPDPFDLSAFSLDA